MPTQYMTDLPKGAVFIGPDQTTHYRVDIPATDHPRGWVEVWDLSMTDIRVAELLATPGAVEQGCDPREGFFAFSHPVSVEVVP